MKQILFIATLLTCLSIDGQAQDNANLLPGRDAEVSQQTVGVKTCRVYTNYVVKTEPSAVGGEHVDVFRNPASNTGNGACSDAKEPIISLTGTYTARNLNIDDEITSSFSGLSGKYLFIQKIVEPFVGAIEIFDLSTARSVYNDEIYGSFTLVQKRFLDYEKWSRKDGLLKNCSQAAKWKKGGLGVGWVRKHRLDTKTLKVRNGTLRCEAQQ